MLLLKSWRKISLSFTIIIICLIFTIYLIVIRLSISLKQKNLIIETKNGKILGKIVKRFGKEIHCFLGVPYAEPPLGELRFARPKPKQWWNGTLKTTKSPNVCFQSFNSKLDNLDKKLIKAVPDWKHFYQRQRSEDCLYLNIYVPNNDKSQMTVMIWIHGGSFQSGSISTPLYDGSVLSAKHNVIVVSMNYRLGVFGFLTAESTQLTGNYGLYDQIMALQWIQENIERFGGNPQNVVLFGESAGAISIGYHLITPLSENLFSRAILQSGNPIVPIMLLTKKALSEATIQMIKLLNCSSINSNQSLNELSIQCLRQKNASIIYELSDKVFPNRKGAFLPIENEHFFNGHPFDLVKKRSFYKQKQILIGTNNYEGAYFANYGPFKKFWSKDKISMDFTKEKVIEILNTTIPLKFRDYINDAVDYALDNLSNNTNAIQVWKRFIRIVGDIIFVCSDYLFINQFSSSNRSVYYYQFRAKPSLSFGPKWAEGAVHGEEIPYVFGLPLIVKKSLDFNFTNDEIELSQQIMNIWTNFAKTGKPFSRDVWHPYSYDKPVYMSFDLRSHSNPPIYMNQGFPGYKCDEYYEQLITSLRNYFKEGNNIPV